MGTNITGRHSRIEGYPLPSNNSTGGGATGPTGPTGPAGGALAYGAVTATATATVAAGGNVTFNITAGPSSGITQGAAGFTVITTGVYYYEFQVRGTPETLTPPNPLIFSLKVAGAAVAATQFASDTQSTSLAGAGTEAVNGSGYITLTAAQTVALFNNTNSGTDSVGLASVPLGGSASVNASLILRQVA